MTKKNKLNEKFELTFSIRSIAYYFLCIYLIYVFKVTSPGNMTHLGIYMVSCFIGLALFIKYVPEFNNIEILSRLSAIIIVYLYSIYKLFNYLKRI